MRLAEASTEPGDLPAATRRKMPRVVEPQLATAVDRPPDGDQWLHELKFDGYRAIALKTGSHVQMMTRRGNAWTDHFPTVAEAVGQLAARELVLDGEVTVVARWDDRFSGPAELTPTGTIQASRLLRV